MKRWKQRESKLIYSTPFIKVYEDKVELPSRKVINYARLILNSFVAIVPISKDGKVVMVKSYRYPLDEYLLEIPSGDMKENENPEETARRELEEETGYKAGTLERLIWYYPNVDRSKQKVYIFLATDLKKGKINRDTTEEQEIAILSAEEALEKVERGEIKDPSSIIGLMYLLLSRRI